MEQSDEWTLWPQARFGSPRFITGAGTGVRACVHVWGELSAFSLLAEEEQSARHLSRSAEGNFLPLPSLLCCSLLCVTLLESLPVPCDSLGSLLAEQKRSVRVI